MEVACHFRSIRVDLDPGISAGWKKRIQKLLEEAEKKQRRMEELRKSGQGVGKSEEAWDTTMRRAAGEKIKDDPKLLRKSMKRMQRQKQKSKERWAEQLENVKDAKDKKQDIRDKNVKERDEKKKAKRMGKAYEDPAKKKASRPGFEGKVNGKLGGGGGGDGGGSDEMVVRCCVVWCGLAWCGVEW